MKAKALGNPGRGKMPLPWELRLACKGKKEIITMEEKKVLKDEELEKAVGGVGEDGYATVVCCPRDKSHIIVSGNHFGEAYGVCSKCHSQRLGVALYYNRTLEQIKEGYEFLAE